MTVPSTTRRAGPYLGNGVTTAFPFTFKVFAASDIALTKTSATGIDTALVLDADYSIALNPDQDATPGGTITYPLSGDPLAVGETLVGVGALPYDQTTDFPSGGSYRATTHEDTFDRVVQQIQQLAEAQGRALTLPPSAAGADTVLPSPEANAVIGWNATASGLTNLDPSVLASIVAFGTAQGDMFTGDGATTSFALSFDPGVLFNLDVAIDGVTQVPPGDFVWAGGTTLTFISPPPSGAHIYVRYIRALPQSSQVIPALDSAKFLTNDGTNLLWGDPPAGGSEAINVTAAPYSAVGDGAADDAAAIQAAVTAAATEKRKVYLPGGTYKINSQISVPSNVEIFGDGVATVVQLGTAGMNGFVAASKTSVIVRDLKILGTLVSAAAYTGGVVFDGSTKCRVSNVEFVGMTWAGVYLNNAQQCTVEGCRFSGWLGTVQDRADIIVYRDSNYNTIRGNHCYGGGNHGILIQDPYTPSYPTGNIVVGNQVGEHTGNGISLYKTTAYDDYTIIANNVVRDVLGTDLAGLTGSGIFLQSASGTVVVGNTISNCCRSTTDFDTQAVGSITVGTGAYGSGNTSPVVVSGNHVFAQRGPGIFANTSDKAITIEGNTIRSTGTANVRGEGILAINCAHVKIHNNTIYHANTNFQALRVTSSAGDYSYHQCTGNTVFTSGGGGIMFNQAGGGTSTNGLVSNNTVWSSAAVPAYTFEACSNYRITGNFGESTNGVVFSMTNCPRARLSANRFYSAYGTYSIIFTGTNTGSVVDETNDLAGVVENDPGSGVMITQIADAAPPGSGLWAVGDRVIRRTATIGSWSEQRCTTGGNPGTWTVDTILRGGAGATLATNFVNPLFDLYGANDPTVGPPVSCTAPGSAVKETTIVYPDNQAGVSVKLTTSGTSVGNGMVITPGLQPPFAGGPVSIGIALRGPSATRRLAVHAFDGTTRTLIGQTTLATTWEWITGTFTPAAGAAWQLEISVWDGTTYYSGFNAYVGGLNVVKGSTPPLTIEDSISRRAYTVITAAAPTLAPDFTGERWYDTAAGKFYMAKGQTGVVDWVVLN